MRILLGFLFSLCALFGQTYDFSGASGRTTPWRVLDSEPGRCVVNEVYYNGTTGKLRVCSAANVWSDLETKMGPFDANGNLTVTGTATIGTTVLNPTTGVTAPNLTLDATLGNYFMGESGANFRPLGSTAPRNPITGSANSGFGRAIWSLTSGNYNSAFGIDSLGFVSSGSSNSGFGLDTLAWDSIGYQNAAMGTNALWSTTVGYQNTGAGYQACRGNTSGWYNTCLGANADLYNPDLTSTVFTATNGSANLTVGSYFYAVSFVLDGVETALSDNGYWGTATDSTHREISISVIPTYTGPKVCTARKIYRTPVSQATVIGPARRWYLVTTLANNTSTTYVDTTADASLGAEDSGPHMSLMVGAGAKAYKSNQAIIGSTAAPFLEWWLNDEYSATPYAVQISSAGGSGTNTAGANMTLQGGAGTGSAVGGSVKFQTYAAGSTGTLRNTTAVVNATFAPGSNQFPVNTCGGAGAAGVLACGAPLHWFSDANSGAEYMPALFQNYNSAASSAVAINFVSSGSTTYTGNGSAKLKFTRQASGATIFNLLLAPGSAGTQAVALALDGSVTTASRANKATCWKADGVTIGWCSTVVDASGGCTCN